MRHYLLLLVIGFTICLTSCRNDFEFEPSSGNLEFSRDTVYLDTVFSNIGSSTYTLKVYNRSDKDISIPSLRLKKGEASKYRLMVDGMPGKVFNDIELMAKDSMFIFIETTVNIAEANPDDFLYTDEIEFYSTNGVQDVNLVTLIKDAYFLYPRRNDEGLYEAVRFDSESNTTDPVYIYGFNLDHADPDNGDEYHWNNTKPYVIYGYATVPDGETLVVDPGARIHYHAGSGLMVRPGGRLEINGQLSVNQQALENEVIFEGDRLEPAFSDVSGQWSAVLIMSGAENSINHLTLKNAGIGIYAVAPQGDNTTVPKLNIRNSQVYNCGSFGLLAENSNITAENIVINRSGRASLALTFGGNYNFKHCTIANYSNGNNQVPLLMNDARETATSIDVTNLTAQFTNCIFFGSGNYAISLEHVGADAGTIFNYTFTNCLIKFFDFSNDFEDEELYQFTGPHYIETVIAENSNASSPKPDFSDTAKNNFKLKEGSAAINLGTDTAGVSNDIRGAARVSKPDAGAYEYTGN
jgi:hypothetical protein